MQAPENILLLINKYLAGTITPEEKLILDEWYHLPDDTAAESPVQHKAGEQEMADRLKSRILQTIHSGRVAKKRIYNWQIRAAAILLIVFSVGAYLIFSSKSDKPAIAATSQPQVEIKKPIVPGGNKAMLTLADGSLIVLDSASNGMLSRQGNSKIHKLQNGQIAYNTDTRDQAEKAAILYNTITTPRGGQYQVTLADGTKVWLNAASSIRFPAAFAGTERRVEITGEAYFEVAKNASMPFIVKANSAEIKVLGTHFNVNAYTDEPIIKTTLLEGSVKVSSSGEEAGQPAKYLKPGQQAGIDWQGKISILQNADTEEAVAWKNGRFQFKSTDIQSILRQISRWYVVDVEYKGKVNLHFTGQLTRNEDVSSLFEKLALTGEVHFKIDGKKIIVSP